MRQCLPQELGGGRAATLLDNHVNDDTVSAGRDPLRSMTGFALYLSWMLLAPVLLGICLLILLRTPTWTLSWVDVAYWAVVAAAHIARTLQSPPPGDAALPPLPIRAWRIRFSAMAAVVWCLGQSLQVLA